MKGPFCLVAVAGMLGLGGTAQAQPLQPDLVIVAAFVAADNTTAVVLVRNQGSITSGRCRLRMDVYTQGGALVAIREALVEGLPPGQQRWVPVHAAPVFIRPFRILKFHVDWTNLVPESNEGNNRFTLIT